MSKLLSIQSKDDIPQEFQETPIGDLLLYHNLNATPKSYASAPLLIGTCMDNRLRWNLPENFAYMVRVGGADMREAEFRMSYAIGVGGLNHLALIGHTQCGMVGLNAHKETYVKGMCEQAGWDEQTALDYFLKHESSAEIGNEVDFVVSQAKQFSEKFPKVKVASLLYKVEDHQLYWIDPTA